MIKLLGSKSNFLLFFLFVGSFNLVFSSGIKYQIIRDNYRIILSDNQLLKSSQNMYMEDSNEIWRLVNYPENRIEIFDSNNGKLNRTIQLPTSIPSYSGFCIKDNSIILRADGVYIIINKKGKLEKEIDIPILGTDNHTPIVPSGSFNPMIVIGDYLYDSGLIIMLIPRKGTIDISSDKFLNMGVIRKVNLKTGELSYIGRQDKKALTSYYGGLNRYYVSSSNSTLIVTSGFSSDIQLIRNQGNSLLWKNTNSKAGHSIKPFCSLNQIAKHTYQAAFSHFDKSDSYLNLIYDKYKNIFYRLIKSPGPLLSASFSMEILDDNFNVLSIIPIPSEYSVSNYFVNKEGIHFANKLQYNKDDSKVIFDLFYIEK